MPNASITLVRAPTLGSPDWGHPDLFRCFPICFHSLFRDLFRFALVSSNLLRFLFRTKQRKPLSCRPLLQVPELAVSHQNAPLKCANPALLQQNRTELEVPMEHTDPCSWLAPLCPRLKRVHAPNLGVLSGPGLFSLFGYKKASAETSLYRICGPSRKGVAMWVDM